MEPDAEKVLIYATAGGRLLVFDEPDFPEIELQVPGGTVEIGETIQAAAGREFFEETGLDGSPFTFLGIDDYRFEKEGRHFWHRRHYFHSTLPTGLRETWLHSEKSPSGGGAPVLFRFFWIPIGEAPLRLGYSMAAQSSRLS